MERRILVVEDSPTQAESLRLLLEQEGYRVDVATNGREGLERLQQEEPDLVISDVVMPEMDGYAFCHAVKSAKRTKRIPVVLLTQRNMPEDILQGLERGADNFITKPFDDDYLLERLRRIFEHLELRKKGQLEMEVTLRLGVREIVITADKQQIIELVFSTLEEVSRLNVQLLEAKQMLEDYSRNLEVKVQERTAAVRLQGTALEAAANGIVITDRDGRITWANPAFSRLTGYSLEECVGQTLRLVKSGLQDAGFYRNLWDTILGGRVWRGEVVNRRKDGSLYTEEMMITPVLDEQGSLTHFIAIKQDITERKRAEEEIRTLAKFPSENPYPILRVGGDGKILYANEASGRLLGHWQRAVGDLVPPSWGQLVREALARPTHTDHDVTCGDRIYSLFVAPISEAGYVNLYGRDVTDLRRTEEAVRRYVGRLEGLRELDLAILGAQSPQATAQAALQHMRDLIPWQWASVVLLDLQARVATLLASHANGETRMGRGTRLSLEEYGLPEELRSGRVLVVQDTLGARRPPPLDLALQAGGIRSYLSLPLLVQGELIGALNLGADDPGRFTPEHMEIAREVANQVAIAIENARLYEAIRRHAEELEQRVRDRTQELAAANQQLETASRHKSEFLANMSHELRTPLNSIIGFADLLLNQGVGPLSDKQGRYLGHIHQGGKHLLQLISDILDLSKVEAGKFVLQPEPLNVATTLDDILVIARGLANKKSQTIQAVIAPDLPPLQADPVRFKQILFNLLSNAVKFTPEQGTITVRAFQQAAGSKQEAAAAGSLPTAECLLRSLVIEVTDTGVGIKAEDLPRLFQEFVQLERTRAQNQEGTGLGLALTKQLVELHDGRIWAESEGEGKGSTFGVRLPCTGPAGPGE